MGSEYELLFEMLNETQKAYKELVWNCKGYYHDTRCVSCLELAKMILMLMDLTNNGKDK